jgi:hypothetical protein
MAIPKGLWDELAENKGWFDETADSSGWFSKDNLNVSSGGASLTATMAFVLDGVATEINATLGHSATQGATLDGVTVAGNATLGHGATLAAQLDGVALDFAATLGHAADSAVALDGITAALNAVTGHVATQAVVLDDITPAIAGTLGHPSELAITLDDATADFAASVSGSGASLTAELAVQLDDVVVDIAAYLPVRGGGIGHGKKRKRYIIKDRMYNLDDGELQQVLAILYKPQEKTEVARPTRKLRHKVAKVAARTDSAGFEYKPVDFMPKFGQEYVQPLDPMMAQVVEAWLADIQSKAYRAWIDEDDEEIALLLAA